MSNLSRVSDDDLFAGLPPIPGAPAPGRSVSIVELPDEALFAGLPPLNNISDDQLFSGLTPPAPAPENGYVWAPPTPITDIRSSAYRTPLDPNLDVPSPEIEQFVRENIDKAQPAPMVMGMESGERLGTGAVRKGKKTVPAPGVPYNETALGAITEVVGNVAVSLDRGTEQIGLDTDAYWASLGMKDWKEVEQRRKDNRAKLVLKPIKGNNFLTDILYGAAEMAPGMAQGAMEGVMTAAGVAALGNLGPQALLPEEVATVPAAYVLGSGQFWYRQGTGAMYAAMREKGISHEIASSVAQGMGLPYAVIEGLQVGRIIPAFKEVKGRVLDEALTRTLARVGKEFGVDVAKETGEEVSQEAMAIAAEEGSIGLSNYLDKTKIEQADGGKNVKRLWDTAVQSVGPLSLLLGPAKLRDLAGRRRAATQISNDIGALSEEQKTRFGFAGMSNAEIFEKVTAPPSPKEAEATGATPAAPAPPAQEPAGDPAAVVEETDVEVDAEAEGTQAVELVPAVQAWLKAKAAERRPIEEAAKEQKAQVMQRKSDRQARSEARAVASAQRKEEREKQKVTFTSDQEYTDWLDRGVEAGRDPARLAKLNPTQLVREVLAGELVQRGVPIGEGRKLGREEQETAKAILDEVAVQGRVTPKEASRILLALRQEGTPLTDEAVVQEEMAQVVNLVSAGLGIKEVMALEMPARAAADEVAIAFEAGDQGYWDKADALEADFGLRHDAPSGKFLSAETAAAPAGEPTPAPVTPEEPAKITGEQRRNLISRIRGAGEEVKPFIAENFPGKSAWTITPGEYSRALGMLKPAQTVERPPRKGKQRITLPDGYEPPAVDVRGKRVEVKHDDGRPLDPEVAEALSFQGFRQGKNNAWMAQADEARVAFARQLEQGAPVSYLVRQPTLAQWLKEQGGVKPSEAYQTGTSNRQKAVHRRMGVVMADGVEPTTLLARLNETYPATNITTPEALLAALKSKEQMESYLVRGGKPRVLPPAPPAPAPVAEVAPQEIPGQLSVLPAGSGESLRGAGEPSGGGDPAAVQEASKPAFASPAMNELIAEAKTKAEPAPAAPALELKAPEAKEPPAVKPALQDQELGIDLPKREVPTTAIAAGKEDQGLSGLALDQAAAAEAQAQSQQPLALEEPPAGPAAPVPAPAAPVVPAPAPLEIRFRDDRQQGRLYLELPQTPGQLGKETVKRLTDAGFKHNRNTQVWSVKPSEDPALRAQQQAIGEELSGQRLTPVNVQAAERRPNKLSLSQVIGKLSPANVERIQGIVGESDDPRVRSRFKRMVEAGGKGGGVSLEDMISEALVDADHGAVLRAHGINGDTPGDVERLAEVLSDYEEANRRIPVGEAAREQDAQQMEEEAAARINPEDLRKVQLEVEGKKHSVLLDPERAARWDEAEQAYREGVEFANRQPEQEKRVLVKALQMEWAAEKRKIAGIFNKAELAAQAKALEQEPAPFGEGASESKPEVAGPITRHADGTMAIGDFAQITPKQYGQIGTIMRKRGFDWRDPADVRAILERSYDRPIAPTGMGDEDLVAALTQVFFKGKRAPRTADQKLFTKAVRTFGTTTDPNEAGYLLPSGDMLDFSAKREGQLPGRRAYDHREIGRVMDGDGGTKGMQEFQDKGAIRLITAVNEEQIGTLHIEIIHPPTAQQKATLRSLFENQIDGKRSVYLSMYNGNGEVYQDIYLRPDRNFQMGYGDGAKPARILADIDRFFSGQMPSEMGQFRQEPAPLEQKINPFQMSLRLEERQKDVASGKVDQQIEITSADTPIAKNKRPTEIVARTIKAQEQATGYASIRDIPLLTRQSMAEAAQAVRDPYAEHLRLVFFDLETGAAISVEHYTSKSADAAGDLLEAGWDGKGDRQAYMQKQLDALKERAAKMQAEGRKVGLWLLHNHPTGAATPSGADFAMTASWRGRWFDMGVEYKGHVIINSGEYAVISGGGAPGVNNRAALYDLDTHEPIARIDYHNINGVKVSPNEGVDLENLRRLKAQQDPLLNLEGSPAYDQMALNDPNKLVDFGVSLKKPENTLTVMFLSNNWRVRGAVAYPVEMANNKPEFTQWLTDRRREYGASQVAVYQDGDGPSLLGYGEELIKGGHISILMQVTGMDRYGKPTAEYVYPRRARPLAAVQRGDGHLPITRVEQVGPEQARTLPYPTKMPTPQGDMDALADARVYQDGKDWRVKGAYDPSIKFATQKQALRYAREGFGNKDPAVNNYDTFVQAAQNTPGAEITPDGLLIELVRHQKPEQAGMESVRTGVFYLPAGDKNQKFYRGSKRNPWYGGSQKVAGPTLLRAPLFVKEATGGTAIERAYDALKGKNAHQELMSEVRGIRIWIGKDSALARATLEKHGVDPNMLSYLDSNSQEGNQFATAMGELIVAHAVREAGYDAVVGYSTRRGGAPFISEVFDVREVAYPVPGEKSVDVHPRFTEPEVFRFSQPVAEFGEGGLEQEPSPFGNGEVIPDPELSEGKDPVPIRDAERQKDYQGAFGIPEVPYIKTAGEWVANQWNKIFRELEFLPKAPEYEPLRYALNRLSGQRGASNIFAYGDLQTITQGLSKRDRSLFYKVVYFDDQGFMADSRDEEYKFPGSDVRAAERAGISVREYVQGERDYFNELAAKSPGVQAAMKARAEAWEIVRTEYMESAKKAGFNVDDSFNNPVYYRHQILKYAQEKGVPIGTRIREPKKNAGGVTTRRLGSSEEHNTNYLDAEFEALSNLNYGTAKNGVLAEARALSIYDDLAKQAKDHNAAVMEGVWGEMAEAYNAANPDLKPIDAEGAKADFTRKQGMAAGQFRSLAAAGALPSGNGQWSNFLNALELGADSQVEGENLIAYAGWVLNQNAALRKARVEAQQAKPGSEAKRQAQERIFNLIESLDGLEGNGVAEAALLFKGVSEKKEFTEGVLRQMDQFRTWQDFMNKDTHREWYPEKDRSLFSIAYTIPERAAEEFLLGELADLSGISRDKLQKVVYKVGKAPAFIVPNEVADTLDAMEGRMKGPSILAGLQKPWKTSVLIGPTRLAKYTLRNGTGDAEAMFLGNRRAFTKVPRAAGELWQALIMGKVPARGSLLRIYIAQGGLASDLAQAEMGEVGDIRRLKGDFDLRELGRMRRYMKNAALPFTGYFKVARIGNDYREAILKYAAFIQFREEMLANGGKPKSWGASDRRRIMGLKTVDQRAFQMANDLLGAYDEVGHMGQWLRNYAMPFFSWEEVNTRRYKRLLQNAMEDAGVAEAAGMGWLDRLRATGKVRGQRAALRAVTLPARYLVRLGLLGMMMMGAWAGQALWNHYGRARMWGVNGDDPDDDPERDLELYNPQIAYAPHVTFGRDAEGKVIVFTRTGILTSMLEWVGADRYPRLLQRYLSGKASGLDTLKRYVFTLGLDDRRSFEPGELMMVDRAWMDFKAGPERLKEGFEARAALRPGGAAAERDYVLGQILMGPTQKVVNMIGPLPGKLLAEEAFGVSSYPDITRPKPIPNRFEHLLKTFGQEYVDLYRKLPGVEVPHKEFDPKNPDAWLKALGDFFIYRVDVKESAYWAAYNLQAEYMRAIGKGREGWFWSENNQNLADIKATMRYNQPELTEKFLQQYLAGGGTIQGVRESIAKMEPLSLIPSDQRQKFADSLTPDEKRTVTQALKYYEETLLDDGGFEEMFTKYIDLFLKAGASDKETVRREVARYQGMAMALKSRGRTDEAAGAQALVEALIERGGGQAKFRRDMKPYYTVKAGKRHRRSEVEDFKANTRRYFQAYKDQFGQHPVVGMPWTVEEKAGAQKFDMSGEPLEPMPYVEDTGAGEGE